MPARTHDEIPDFKDAARGLTVREDAGSPHTAAESMAAAGEPLLPPWAANLKRLTERSGLTQAELARRAGLQRDAYGRYTLGKTRPPAPKLLAIAKVLGVDPREIDPDRDDLEEAALRDAGPMPYRITPARGADPRKVFLEISAEVDIADALKIVELMVAKK